MPKAPKNNSPGRQEYDGVIYEPSSDAKRAPRGDQPATRPRGAASHDAYDRPRPRKRAEGDDGFNYTARDTLDPSSRKRKKTKPKFAAFYIVTLLAGVIVCLVLFAMAFQSMMQNNPVIEGNIKATPTPLPDAGERDVNEILGMVTAIKATGSDKTVSLLDLSSGRTVEYAVTDATEIKNQYGSPMSFSECEPGKIVEATYEAKTTTLTTLSISAQAWELKHINNVKIDTEGGYITVGNDIYSFGSQTLVLYNGAPYSIGRIQSMDMLSLTGYMDKVWCVRMDSSHGFIRIENADTVINGTLAVDTSIFMGLEDATEAISLTEGTHRVIIEGYNIEPYITDVTVRPNETTYVNLIDAKIKTAMLKVTVNEPDSAIIIDGESTTGTGPWELSFGDHTVRVEKDGFLTVQQEVTINKAYTELSIDLDKIAKTGRLIIYTDPSTAEIFIDNALAGYSTLTYEVELGAHTVIARKNGYKDNTITVNVTEGENTYYLLMTEETSDPFGNLPALPGNTQPIDDQSINQ